MVRIRPIPTSPSYALLELVLIPYVKDRKTGLSRRLPCLPSTIHRSIVLTHLRRSTSTLSLCHPQTSDTFETVRTTHICLSSVTSSSRLATPAPPDAMFTTPTTSSRYTTWPRYNAAAQLASSPTDHSHLTHQQQQLSAEEKDLLSSSPPALSSSSPLLHTPFAFRSSTYSINPLASPITPSQRFEDAQLVASPDMPAFPETPSPPSFGISGVTMGNGAMMG